MESLHAPWRIEYILAPKPESAASLFTRIAQSNDDEANHVIARDRTCFALLNTYPYTGGHLMIVPYKQAPDLNGLTEEELTDLMKLTRRCQDALTKVMKPDGFNIGINLGKVAGAGCWGICTSTLCRAGRATRTSCRSWRTPSWCPKPCGNWPPNSAPLWPVDLARITLHVSHASFHASRHLNHAH